MPLQNSQENQQQIETPPGSSPSPSSREGTSAPITSSPTARKIDYELGPGEIGVRFINSPLGHDVIAAANLGDPLLSVGDSVGVFIPRACKSGLCGSCTCDVLDANAEDGRQTIRACQASAFIPDDGVELIVDVARMKQFKGKVKDPMSRFENMDTEYVAGAAPGVGRRNSFANTPITCTDCVGAGQIECYNCDGSGLEGEEEDFASSERKTGDAESSAGANRMNFAYNMKTTCYTCGGMKVLRCSTCQGVGEINLGR